MSHPTTETEAVWSTVRNIEKFRTNHNTKSLISAIQHGAFQTHPDFGDVTYIFKDREFDPERLQIPQWILDTYEQALETIEI